MGYHIIINNVTEGKYVERDPSIIQKYKFKYCDNFVYIWFYTLNDFVCWTYYLFVYELLTTTTKTWIYLVREQVKNMRKIVEVNNREQCSFFILK